MKRTQIVLLLLLVATFIYILPTLGIYKVDGDIYSFLAYVRDGLSGRPMNVSEPMFNSGMRVGVRLALNQYLPLNIMWSYFTPTISLTDLIGYTTRSMIAVWATLSFYMLGKNAKGNDRRFGLFTAGIALLIYMSALFLRSDSESSFFYLRINTDKFTVPITCLPVSFALTFRFLREKGRKDAWLGSAGAALATAVIHPLVAAMYAVAYAGWGAFHLLMNLRNRIAWKRVFAMIALVVIVMSVPLMQFIDVKFGEPMAPTFPNSLNGWSVGP